VRLETSVGAQDDRAEAIDVDYEPLPPVLDMRTALEPGSRRCTLALWRHEAMSATIRFLGAVASQG
jgi:CO/xanthine dehydrogenase Mo-binding subunit